MRINHNIPALIALNQLDQSNSSLSSTMERLSSGLRINHAADDAAGLAITQKMDTQVRGLDQANRNAMDGISLIQTAEGALNEVNDILQRIRELAVQASNDTYDTEDREAVQTEVDELLEEIDRISEAIEFNEMTLLDGNLDYTNYSSDTDVADVVYMSDGVDPGTYNFTVTSEATQTTATSNGVDATFYDANDEATVGGTISINGESVTIEVGDTEDEVYAKIRDLGDLVDVSVSYDDTTQEFTFTDNYYGDNDLEVTGTSALITGLGLEDVEDGTAVNVGADVVIDETTIAGDFPSDTTYTSDGENITFTASGDFELRLEGGDSAGAVEITILESGPLDLQVGANEGQFMQVRIPEITTSSLEIDAINLSTGEGAQEAIATIDDAIETVSSTRSRLGAYQNRLEHTIDNLGVASENMTSALSRILDADMAYEMAEFTQQNIIQQAGTSMLAQANQLPEALLQLLQ